MWRQRIRMFVVGAIVAVASIAVAAPPKITVTNKNVPLTFSQGIRPFFSQMTVMVPLRETSAMTGVKLALGPDGKQFTVSFKQNSVSYELGHHGYRLNGHRQNMHAASELRKGHLYVPIRLFNDVTSGRVHAEIVQK